MATNLIRLPVLALDCQANGSTSRTCEPIEIGWSSFRAIDVLEASLPVVVSHLIRLPEGCALPRQVIRITGITEDTLSKGILSGDVWHDLVSVARQTAEDDGLDVCPAVIHYARFEEPMLRRLHEESADCTPFPFRIICTHEIAKRLLPGLPRKGLRAVAGYLGHGAGEYRRSHDHVAATIAVWCSLSKMLSDDQGINTLDELAAWLAVKETIPRCRKEYPMMREARLNLPDSPGIYRMIRSNGEVLYVGKAKSLKRRVNSYFTKQAGHAEHILEMLSQAVEIDTTSAGSAFEAAILENDEIKLLAPPYNRALRQRDRNVWFATRDFSSISEKADSRHVMGPFTSRETPIQTGMLLRLFKWGDTISEMPAELAPEAVLGIPSEYAPDANTFRDGVMLFFKRRGSITSGRSPLKALLHLGITLWAESMAEGKKPMDDDTEETVSGGDDADIELTAQVWTSESAAVAVENAVSHCARMIRRGRWFCRLSESTVTWSPPDSSGAYRRIAFSRGRFLADMGNTQESDAAPDYGMPNLHRLACFDIGVYDRMRVATTELKRLVAERRDIELHLSPSGSVSRRKLASIIAWI